MPARPSKAHLYPDKCEVHTTNASGFQDLCGERGRGYAKGMTTERKFRVNRQGVLMAEPQRGGSTAAENNEMTQPHERSDSNLSHNQDTSNISGLV